MWRRLYHSKTLEVGATLNKRSFANTSNIVQSSLPEINIPNLTIPQFTFQHFDKFPHKIAVECALTGKKLTFEEVRVKSRNLNQALRKKLKLARGDVVVIILPNIPEYPVCIFGALQAGLKVTPVNPLYTSDEIQRHLLDADAKVIITLGILWPTVQNAVRLLPNRVPILTIKTQESESTPQGSIQFSEFTDAQSDIGDLPPADVNDVALTPYSSGTTGLPKGVELTHHSLIAAICQINQSFLKIGEDTTESHQDVVPAVLPFFHVFGLLIILLNQMHNLCRMVSLPQFKPDLFINMLATQKPHVLYAVPPMAIFLSNHPAVKTQHLQSLRTIFSGAAPLGSLDEEKLVQKAGAQLSMIQGYGLTESCVDTMGSKLKKTQLGLKGSTGELVSSTSVKVVPCDDLLGDALGPNQPGELLIKGPQVMKGYHNRPEETKEAFVDGWLRTGDMGYYDDNRMFYITDRLKELIKVKGYQVAPAEMEAVIRSHPDVVDAAVIGVPHSRFGEVPKAYVVAKRDVKVNGEKLAEFVAEKVADYKQIRGGVVVVDSIPKTVSGKILRRDLKRQHEGEAK